MKLTFFGAAQQVTGSKHLLEIHNFKLLLDCGLEQGGQPDQDEHNHLLPFPAEEIGAVVLSHAHVDHSGMLPVLVREGFHGHIFSTKATADISQFLLADAAKIQEQDAIYKNDRMRPGEDPVYPEFTQEDVDAAMPHFEPVTYARLRPGWHHIAPGVEFKFYDAGHILGSASPVLKITEHEQTHYIAYSGDLGQKVAPLLPPPEHIAEPIETLILECTYGNSLHATPERTKAQLKQIIQKTFDRGGKLIIPAFSLGRTQALLYLLHEIRNESGLPDQNVYLDSPLAEKLLDVFKKHPEDYDDETWQDFPKSGKETPFDFPNLVLIKTISESQALNSLTEPGIIISASGMAEGGRIVHHLRHGIDNANNTVLFTGYQANRTLGRKIQDHVNPVRIMGRPYRVEAEIATLDGLSAHADQEDLLSYVANLEKSLKRVFLVHCELPQAVAFQTLLKERYPTLEVIIPRYGQTIEL